MLDPKVRRHLHGNSVAHFARIRADGSPRAVPVWIGVYEDGVVMLTGPRCRRARELRRDPLKALYVAPIDPEHQTVGVESGAC